MLDYIWLDDESPILQQVPVEYSSAALIFSPFIQMPEGWEMQKEKMIMNIFIQTMMK